MTTNDTTRTIPTVRWGEHAISRLIVGHNPLKGHSHFTEALNDEMAAWYDPEAGNDLDLLARCETEGVNTAQFGSGMMHRLLERHAGRGGRMQWIATVYDRSDGDDAVFEQELEAIRSTRPTPIGLQYFGERADDHFIQGRTEYVRDRLKRMRQTGLLVGLGSHLPQTLARAADEDWDVDFYQCCFYTVYAHVGEGRIDRGNETFDDTDRDRMAAFVAQADKPCLAFKILGASRNCATPAEVEAAFRYAFERIKPTDAVIVGMWQKYSDQVGMNADIVRRILARQSSPAE
jgi:hypothetical protein